MTVCNKKSLHVTDYHLYVLFVLVTVPSCPRSYLIAEFIGMSNKTGATNGAVIAYSYRTT